MVTDPHITWSQINDADAIQRTVVSDLVRKRKNDFIEDSGKIHVVTIYKNELFTLLQKVAKKNQRLISSHHYVTSLKLTLNIKAS